MRNIITFNANASNSINGVAMSINKYISPTLLEVI